MARATQIPAAVIGQPSEATLQFSSQRANRLQAAMQEAGATQRQAMATRSQQMIAGMQEQGAMERAKLGEAGADRRAQLGAETTRQGQQLGAEVSREQIAASDRQAAAAIRANMERDELRERGENERQRLRLEQDDAFRKADDAFRNKQFDMSMALTKDAMDRDAALSALNFVETVTGNRVLRAAVQKQMGAAQWQASQEKLRREYIKGFQATTQANEAKDMLADAFLAQEMKAQESVIGRVESLFSGVTSHVQNALTLDLFEPAQREKLAEQAENWTPTEFHTAHRTLEKLRELAQNEREKRAGTVKRGDTKAVYGGFTMHTGSTGQQAADLKYLDESIQRIDAALRVLDAELPLSTRPMRTQAGPLGKHIETLKQSYRGLTAEAAEARAAELYPNDTDAFMRETLNLVKGGLDADPDTALALLGPFLAKMSPEAKAMAIASIRQIYGPVFPAPTPELIPGLGLTGARSYDVPLPPGMVQTGLAGR